MTKMEKRLRKSNTKRAKLNSSYLMKDLVKEYGIQMNDNLNISVSEYLKQNGQPSLGKLFDLLSQRFVDAR